MKRFRLGDRIRIVQVDSVSPPTVKKYLGATGTVLAHDPRSFYYEEYWMVWPDDESLCNPGSRYRAWCIRDSDKSVELISRALIEELLTSEHSDWRKLGKQLQQKTLLGEIK